MAPAQRQGSFQERRLQSFRVEIGKAAPSTEDFRVRQMLGLVVLFFWLAAIVIVVFRDYLGARETADRPTAPTRRGRAMKALHMLTTLIGSGAAAWGPLQLSLNALRYCEAFLHVRPPSFADNTSGVLFCALPFLLLLVLAATFPARRPRRMPTFAMDLIVSLAILYLAAEEYKNGDADCAPDDDNGLALVLFILVFVWPWSLLSAISRVGALAIAKLISRFDGQGEVGRR